jgi:PucR C-terminal helix-turn-helix domain
MDARQREAYFEPIQPALSGEFARFALGLEDRLEELSAATLVRLRAELPPWAQAEVIGEQEVARFVRASLAAQLRSFRARSLPDRCPPVDAEGARAAARLGDLRALLSGYRIAHMVLWEAWLDLIEGSGVEAAIRYELLRFGSQFLFRYAAILSDYVSDRYQAALEQSLRSGEQRRFQALKGLLEGRPSPSAELDLNLDQHHLGLLAWGEDAHQLARELSAALARPLLTASPFEGLWWGWLSGAQPLGSAGEAAAKRLAPPSGSGLALGLEGVGEGGFRATHRQAQRAHRIALRLGLSVVLYADVAVEALLGDNPADARAFVAHELRGIEDDSAASQRIRETIAAYFAHEHNAASAAAALGVHQQTVANRLRAAEERLGRPVASRRVELETALRLRASLDS